MDPVEHLSEVRANVDELVVYQLVERARHGDKHVALPHRCALEIVWVGKARCIEYLLSDACLAVIDVNPIGFEDVQRWANAYQRRDGGRYVPDAYGRGPRPGVRWVCA